MHAQDIVLAPPVRGNWVIYNPPGHPALAFDFLAENDNKSLYRKGGFLRHLISSIRVEVLLRPGKTLARSHDSWMASLLILYKLP